jgi:site-specific DNA-methyltransferase (adenine-specific)
MYNLYHGDCLELMKDIPDNSVDCIICDLPYGITGCEWDNVIDYQQMWKEIVRIVKYNTNCLFFCNQPFSSSLITSNKEDYSHMLYWKKNYTTGFLSSNRQPLRCVEEIAVFICCRYSNDYTSESHSALKDYMISELKKSGFTKKQLNEFFNSWMASTHYFTRNGRFDIPSKENYIRLQKLTKCFPRAYEDIRYEYDSELKKATYNPVGVKDCSIHKSGKISEVYSHTTEDYVQTKTNYPSNLLEFNGLTPKSRVHPTQKPVNLLEYLIKTYSNEGDTILDFTMGSGSTGVACMNTGRKFIGIEKDEKYFKIAEERIKEASNNLNKFME